jgi:hypothetical protein
MALKTLLSARAGLESSRGSDTTPTRLIYFDEGTHEQKLAIQRPMERRASYVQAFRSSAGIERNIFTFGSDVTYDDLIWWANVHVKAVAAGTGAGADKTWAFLPTHTSDDLKSGSLQFGYTDAIGATRPAWKVLGVLGDELTINVSKSSPWTFRSRLMAPGAATQLSAFTGSLSDRTTTTALGTTTQTYVDSTTIGTTADNDILDAAWTLSNGFVYLDTLNATNVAQEILRPNARDWSLAITRYFRNDTELDAMLATTVRKIRLQTTGPVLGGSNYRIRLDLYGVWDGDQYEKAEVDGLGVEKFVLVPQYDGTATTDFSLEVVNATAAIT